MNRPAAVHAGNAVAHVIAVAALTCTDIPAVGQCVAERQRITVLQVIAGHGRTGVEVRTADGVHPAGTHCVIKLTDAGACTGQRDAVAVDAAPEDCLIAARAEVTVNSGEDFVLCTAELTPVAAECVRAAAKAGNRRPWSVNRSRYPAYRCRSSGWPGQWKLDAAVPNGSRPS